MNPRRRNSFATSKSFPLRSLFRMFSFPIIAPVIVIFLCSPELLAVPKPLADQHGVKRHVDQPLHQRIKFKLAEDSVADEHVVGQKLQNREQQPGVIWKKTEQRNNTDGLPGIPGG